MLKGKITISTPRGAGIDCVQIEFIDELSQTRFLQATVSYKEFARAVTGLGNRPCEFELCADKVGLTHEYKTERVFVPDGEFATRKGRAREAVQAIGVDGWRGRVEDALNHHGLAEREGQGAWYAVTFWRYV